MQSLGVWSLWKDIDKWLALEGILGENRTSSRLNSSVFKFDFHFSENAPSQDNLLCQFERGTLGSYYSDIGLRWKVT